MKKSATFSVQYSDRKSKVVDFRIFTILTRLIVFEFFLSTGTDLVMVNCLRSIVFLLLSVPQIPLYTAITI